MKHLLTAFVATVNALVVACAIIMAGPAFGLTPSQRLILFPPAKVATATYQGPLDVYTNSPYAAYSCTRALSAAVATANGNLCDLVDSAAPTTVICTLKALSTGAVNLASTSCTGGLTPSAKCAAATGGVCNISQAYDQTGNGRPVVQTTVANQPSINFAGSPSGSLPVISCNASASTLQTSATLTQAQPLSASIVTNNTNGTGSDGVLGGTTGSGLILAGYGTTNPAINAGTPLSVTGVTNTWYAINTLASGASSAINLNGTDTTGNAGTGGLATAIRVCGANGLRQATLVAEAIIWSSADTASDRGNLSSNARAFYGF